MPEINWSEAVRPLLKKYKGKQHPLHYGNTYQLIVMVVLSARSTDKLINDITPEFFAAFPNMEALSQATPAAIEELINGVRSFVKKAKWLSDLSQIVRKDENIPLTMDELVALPGMGRKSANVIKRESGAKAEGIIVDLHVVRVAPRLGIASGTDPKKIEKK